MNVDANALFTVRLPDGVPYNDAHWGYLNRYYSKYDEFLLDMYKALEGANIEITTKNAALNEVYSVIKTMTRLTHEMREFMQTYYAAEGEADAKLIDKWESRIGLYRAVRELMRSVLPYFKECEAMFVFSARIGRFMERSDPGIIELQLEMNPKVEARRELVDKYYAAINGDKWVRREIGARLSVLTQLLDLRMEMYDKEEDVRAAYVAITNNNNNNTVKVKIEDALTEYYDTTEEVVEEFDIETNSQALESLHNVVVLASTKPTLLYRDNQLVFASDEMPVVSLETLDIDDVTRTRMDMHRVAPRDLRESEYITDNQRLIALVPSAFDMQAFLRANIGHVISTMVTAHLDVSVFTGFRVAAGNCIVRRVTLEGRPIEVLVATREVKKDVQLYRDYSDGDLYKMWEAYHDTSPVVVGRGMPRSQKLRQYVGGLQMRRLDALRQQSTEEATDLAIRIKILSALIV